MKLSRNIKLIAAILCAGMTTACQERTQQAGVLSNHGDGIQRLKGYVVHEFTQGSQAGVVIALENGCAIRANKKINQQNEAEYEPTQYACDQMTNNFFGKEDAKINANTKGKSIHRAAANVLTVQISKQHMPLSVIETPDSTANKLWMRTYSS